MTDTGDSTNKDIDEHPAHMQFFKYAQMKYLSDEAVAILQSYCYGPNREVCDFMYMLMRYYYKQKRLDDEYIAEQLRAGIEKLKQNTTSSDAKGTVAESVASTPRAAIDIAPNLSLMIKQEVIDDEDVSSTPETDKRKSEDSSNNSTDDEFDCSLSTIAVADEPVNKTPTTLRSELHLVAATPRPTSTATTRNCPSTAKLRQNTSVVCSAQKKRSSLMPAPIHETLQNPVVAPNQIVQQPRLPQAQFQENSQATQQPRLTEDPMKVAILSCNLVKLNQQIDYINQIRTLAREQELASELFFITASHLDNPSPKFKLSAFHEMKDYASKLATETDDELVKFDLPVVAHLRSTLEGVEREIEGIWENVRTALRQHDKKLRRHERQQQIAAQGARKQHPDKQRSSMKRSDNDPMQQPPAKRPRDHLLDTPVVTADAASSKWVSVPSTGNPSTSAVHTIPAEKCPFCSDEHDPVVCPVYKTPIQRAQQRKNLDLCWHCLLPFVAGHYGKCNHRDELCTHCGKHFGHPALCRSVHKPSATDPWPGNRPIKRSKKIARNTAQFSPVTTPVYETETPSPL